MSYPRRHEPERMCLGCKKRGPKDCFIRVVRLPSQEVVIDEGGSLQGRGAYVCRSAECLEKTRKRKAFARSLKVDEGSVPFEALFSAIVHRD